MYRELSGDGVKKEIEAYIRESVNSFAAEGIVPKLAVIRAGDDNGQKYYENAILRQSHEYGIETQAINFTSNISQALIEVTLQAINEDESVHGKEINIDGEAVFNTVVHENNRAINRTGLSPLRG